MARAPVIPGLAPSHRAALDAVRAQAAAGRAQRLGRLQELVAGTGVGAHQLLAEVARQSTLTLNFHPDRLLADGRSVARALLDEGIYRSQFETGISNGGLTAHPGGDPRFGSCHVRLAHGGQVLEQRRDGDRRTPDPGPWADWGPPAEVLVQLKALWLMLVALGRRPR